MHHRAQGCAIDYRERSADTRGVIRKFNDCFAYMPPWLGATIAGGLTFASMTALLAVDGDIHPLTQGAICGGAVGLIAFATRHVKQRPERGP